MKKSKWLTSIGLAATIAFGGLLTGCGTDEKSGVDANGSTEKGNEVVELTLSSWGSSPTEQRIFEETLKAFEEEHPHIKVKLDIIADQYMDVLRTRLIGNTAADVFFLDAFEAPALMATGVLEPLDEYVTEDFDVVDFEDPLLNAFKYDGVTYGFPKDTSTLALFYNLDLFEEAGLERAPKTWEELVGYAKILKEETGVHGFGIVPDLARNVFLAESKGGKIATDNRASFGTPEVVEALQTLIDMRNVDGSAASPADVGANWGGEMFGQGRAAMMFEGNWTISFLEDTFPNTNYATAEIPMIDDNKGSMAFTVAYAMNKNTEYKDEAWELISWLTGKEGMKKWTGSGFVFPSRASVAEELGLFEDEIRAPFAHATTYATVWADDTNLPIINNNFNNEFLSAFLGQKSLEDALKEAERVANSEIE
ncbi:ABC transporter substrate-binding protein [Anaerobacillus alkalilacustris]|uniref:ABC transporter substrate-binding protein n=1 Tax=Anaerobacillus alkalilacustris TaxID=393763 RepID=A0A1S2LXV3_9BACI|nr:ABC transporter substrate-binding protein [Anaerobacillus alkalilacustris]OIJ17060.1 ABC transporter substrate-binding protein [Anaerobacillus alkalilacustris]